VSDCSQQRGPPTRWKHPEYVTMIHRRMVSSRMLRRVALVRTDVSEEVSASFIRVTRIGELGSYS
jgi:hypothetical protein